MLQKYDFAMPQDKLQIVRCQRNEIGNAIVEKTSGRIPLSYYDSGISLLACLVRTEQVYGLEESAMRA